MEINKTFACAINCMDGRVQDAVKNYMQENYNVDYVDMITEPGPNKILADAASLAHHKNQIIDNIRKRVEVSVEHHGSKVIAIVGHFGCAGNPTEKQEQIEHLRQAQKTVESFRFDAEIVLLWVNSDCKTVELVSSL